jgi:hypothetical protein
MEPTDEQIRVWGGHPYFCRCDDCRAVVSYKPSTYLELAPLINRIRPYVKAKIQLTKDRLIQDEAERQGINVTCTALEEKGFSPFQRYRVQRNPDV